MSGARVTDEDGGHIDTTVKVIEEGREEGREGEIEGGREGGREQHREKDGERDRERDGEQDREKTIEIEEEEVRILSAKEWGWAISRDHEKGGPDPKGQREDSSASHRSLLILHLQALDMGKMSSLSLFLSL
jgi:hypothetical protein